MIGWYVDVGYYNGLQYESPYEENLNYGNVVVLDKNSVFTIPESNLTISSSRFEYSTQGSYDAANYLLSSFNGDDYFSIYGLLQDPRLDYPSFEGFVNNIIPSYFLAYVNSNKYAKENLDSYNGKWIPFVIYFKSLSMAILYLCPTNLDTENPYFTYGYSLYEVLEDGSMVLKISDSSTAQLHSTWQNTYFPYFYKVNEEYSFSVVRVNISGFSTPTRNYISISSVSSTLIYSELLTIKQPDFEGKLPGPPGPYDPGGSSGEGGGGGTFDDDSDQIDIPSLPTLSSANTGFTRIYNPTLSQVQELANYLWTDETVIETIWNHIKQYFEDPMEAIIGFNLVPVPVPNGGTENFKLMYIDTGVSMTVAANQFVDVDCGTLQIKEYYGSALDYSPYTKISCFLPFIGNVTLNTDEVMGRTIQVKYRVDICSGACVAYVLVDGNAIYQFSGHCAISIPISAADFSSYVSAIISTAKLATAAIVAGAGVLAPGATENAAQQTNQVITTTQVTKTARNPATGRQITMGTVTSVETRESPADQSSTQASFSGLAPENIANTVGQVMSSKPHIEHSGSFSGNSGYLGVRRPFIIIERPNMCMPSNYQSLNGFPSMITMELGSCKGFTRVQQVQLTGTQATNPEQAEILQLLKSGVIL